MNTKMPAEALLDEQQVPAAVEVGDDAGESGVPAERGLVGGADVGNAHQRSRPGDVGVGWPSSHGDLLAAARAGRTGTDTDRSAISPSAQATWRFVEGARFGTVGIEGGRVIFSGV